MDARVHVKTQIIGALPVIVHDSNGWGYAR